MHSVVNWNALIMVCAPPCKIHTAPPYTHTHAPPHTHTPPKNTPPRPHKRHGPEPAALFTGRPAGEWVKGVCTLKQKTLANGAGLAAVLPRRRRQGAPHNAAEMGSGVCVCECVCVCVRVCVFVYTQTECPPIGVCTSHCIRSIRVCVQACTCVCAPSDRGQAGCINRPSFLHLHPAMTQQAGQQTDRP